MQASAVITLPKVDRPLKVVGGIMKNYLRV